MSATEKQVLKQIGIPREIAKDLRKFRHAAKVLSSDHPRLINEYPDKWVVVFDGEVKTASDSFDAAMAKAKELNLPKASFFVRYIAKKRQTMIFSYVC
jgi:hypothetical protein